MRYSFRFRFIASLIFLSSVCLDLHAKESQPCPDVPPSVENPLSMQNRIQAHWLSLMGKGTSTKEHSKFLKEESIPIKIIESIPGSSMTSFYASYEDGTIYVSKQMLDKINSMIEKQDFGYDAAKRSEVIAEKTADLIVHELRHAMIEKDLRQRLQKNFPLPVLEDEVLAYHDQSRAIAIFQNPFFLTDVRTEVLDDMQKELYGAYIENSSKAIADYIQKWNKVPSILSNKDDLLKWFASNRKGIDMGLDRLQRRLKEIRETPADKRSSDLEQEEAKLVKTETGFLKNIDILESARTVVSDPDQFAIVQGYYRQKLSERFGSQ